MDVLPPGVPCEYLYRQVPRRYEYPTCVNSNLGSFFGGFAGGAVTFLSAILVVRKCGEQRRQFASDDMIELRPILRRTSVQGGGFGGGIGGGVRIDIVRRMRSCERMALSEIVEAEEEEEDQLIEKSFDRAKLSLLPRV